MKILLSAKSVTDRNANYQSSADTRRKNMESRLRNMFLEGLKQSYFKDQSVEYLSIEPLQWNRKTMYRFNFELSNTRFIYDRPYIFGYANVTPSEIADQLNKLHDDNDLLLEDEAKKRDVEIKNKISTLSEMIDPILVKYDVTGQVVVPDTSSSELSHTQRISLNWDIDDILGCECHKNTLTYRQHSLFFSGFYFNGYSPAWDVEKSDKENLKFIENAIAQTVAEVKNWVETVDYVLDNLYDIEDQVNSQLSSFEYDRVAIDDIKVKTDLDDRYISYRSGPRIDDAIIISFHMYGYDGKIDLNVKYTWGEWNSIDINKKLINIIKYRKRKYGLA